MTINRGALRTSVLEYMDAVAAQRWNAASGGEVDLRISSVFDKIWRRILNVNRFYRASKRTPTSDATGRYLVSDLGGSTGDTLQRFYRVLQVQIDGGIYEEGRMTDYALLEAQGGTGRVWYQEGTSIVALPIQANFAADGIYVNWIPQRPSAFSGDAVVLDFPDGYEEVLVVLSAARLLMKGGAETGAARDLRSEVEEDYQDMLSDIARFSTKPLTMMHSDAALDWGGGS